MNCPERERTMVALAAIDRCVEVEVETEVRCADCSAGAVARFLHKTVDNDETSIAHLARSQPRYATDRTRAVYGVSVMFVKRE